MMSIREIAARDIDFYEPRRSKFGEKQKPRPETEKEAAIDWGASPRLSIAVGSIVLSCSLQKNRSPWLRRFQTKNASNFMLEYWYKDKRTLIDFRRGPLGPGCPYR
jgi:hypothetical protein